MQIAIGEVDEAMLRGECRRECRYAGLIHEALLCISCRSGEAADKDN